MSSLKGAVWPSPALLSLVLSACAKSDSANPLDPSAAATGSVTGTVRTTAAAPVDGAAVTSAPATQSATTDSQGRYTLSSIATGSYVLTAKKIGLVKQSVSATVAENALATADTMTLPGGPGYAAAVQPLFNTNCTSCHGTNGGYSLQSYASATAKNVVPFDAEGSVLYKRVSGTSAGSQMPLGGPALSAADQQIIKNWIDAGAPND